MQVICRWERTHMPFPNQDTQFKPGQSGNPKGKAKGTKHLSTWIQELLNDEEFTLDNFLYNGKQFKGAPIKAIITVGIMQALQGEHKWAEWLGKHGYGLKTETDITSGGEKIQPLLGGASVQSNDGNSEATKA